LEEKKLMALLTKKMKNTFPFKVAPLTLVSRLTPNLDLKIPSQK
jgi:hypothetical protein